MEDLLKIQRATGDIVKHIADFAVESVDKGPIHEMRSQYMPKILIEAAFMKSENKIRKIESDIKFMVELCKKIDIRIDGLKEVYTDRRDFEREISKFALAKDVSEQKV